MLQYPRFLYGVTTCFCAGIIKLVAMATRNSDVMETITAIATSSSRDKVHLSDCDSCHGNIYFIFTARTKCSILLDGHCQV